MFGQTSDITAAPNADNATKATLAQDKLEKDLNQFLNLLITQLQNQDPLSPLDANQFTQQLVQFASVEQQIYQNANLEKLVGIQQTSQVGAMVNYLGKEIEANGDVFNLENGTAKFSYDIESKAVESVMTIQDALGKTVFTMDTNLEAGKNIFTWDGVQSDGSQAPDGPYTAIISAKDGNGDLINVAQTVFGRVTSAGAQNGNVVLSMGAVDAPLDQVLNVQEIAAPAAPAVP